MKIDAHDPKWTAYALGEITDEKERAEIESILEASSEMRQLVEEIRQTAGLLREELQAEPSFILAPAQRERIEAKAAAGKSWYGLRPAWVMACAAGAILLVSFLAFRQLWYVKTSPLEQLSAAIPNKPAPPQLQNIESPAAHKLHTALGSARKNGTNQKPSSVLPPELVPPIAAPVSPQITQRSENPPAAAVPVPEPSAPSPAAQPVAQLAVLEGTVKDAAGGILAGATIKVVDESTGSTVQTQTDRSGRFIFPALSPGRHTVTAVLPGFKQTQIADLPVNPGATKKLDLTMQLGGLTEMVTINAEAPTLNTSASTLVKTYNGAAGWMPPGRRMPPMPYPPYRWPPMQRQRGRFNTESYDLINDNAFLDVAQNPLSTFSIDVDTASYSNVRRFLEDGSLPPKDAVRIEELVNYFDYDYKGPKDDKPFAVNFEIAEAPWEPEHRLLRVGLKAREVNPGKRPPGNLVFLLDVSGSMADENKLPLVKESMELLADQLTESDRVAIVVYASDTSILLPSTSGDQKKKIRRVIDRLHAGGSTNGASGIQLAYKTAQENFIKGGTNRVILATDGDFNVGITNRGDLTRLIEEKAKSGVYLSALGFGMGNYKDATLELLANKGQGNYAYIDTLNEAKKVLVEQINATLVTIARDVKIQVEFNPRRVSAYRLIGYEDRLMAKEDFSNDEKKAGVIGAGHARTALYELVPMGVSTSTPGVEPLKYQKPSQPSSAADGDELLTVKIRSKEPEKDKSVLSEFAVKESKEKFSDASDDFKFAAAVAAFGMILRDSPYKGSADLERALEWAKEGKGTDKHGYRQEFIRLIHRAISISF